MTTGLQRGLRRLREACCKYDSAVGMRSGGNEIVLWTGWDDTYGRCRCVEIVTRWPDIDAVRKLAQLAWGPEMLAAFETREGGYATKFRYCLPIDGGALHPVAFGPGIRRPVYVRWFAGRLLEQGLGDSDNGTVTIAGRLGFVREGGR